MTLNPNDFCQLPERWTLKKVLHRAFEIIAAVAIMWIVLMCAITLAVGLR